MRSIKEQEITRILKPVAKSDEKKKLMRSRGGRFLNEDGEFLVVLSLF